MTINSDFLVKKYMGRATYNLEKYFRLIEEIVDMMVYELYFEEEMKTKEIDVLQFVNFPYISKMETFEEKRDAIQKIYYWLKEKDNPIRNRLLVSNIRSSIISRINASTH